MIPQTTNKSSADAAAPFELKGSLFTLTVMYLRRADNDAIGRHLAEKASQAPAFFSNAPLVVDLEALAPDDVAVDFASLYDLLRSRGMIPVGVRNASDNQQSAAMLAGLPSLPETRVQATAKKPADPTPTPARNRLVTQPVRSGQQIYAPDGDLIVLGPISEGAEVLADGNIHIYGTLRGRALAGVKGNTEARIFCRSLEAQLLSIAGCYRVIEQLEADLSAKPVHIYLSGDRLIIEPLC